MKGRISKLLAVLLALVMVAALVPGTALAEEETDTWDGKTADTKWYDEHTGEDTFTIKTAEELAGLAQLVNNGNGFHGKTINLDINIDLDNHEWTPIGIVETSSFRGTFDGQKHTISNLTITNGADRNGFGLGLFGDLGASYSDTEPSVGTIQNLKIHNANITGRGYIGAFVGGGYVQYGRQNGGNIKNCELTGNVHLVASMGSVGGIAGYIPGENNENGANIENCIVSANPGSVIDGNGNTRVGGILGYTGYSPSSIKGCKVSGVTISGSTGVGGIVGVLNQKNAIQDCSVSDITVNSTLNDGTAGLIVGQNAGGSTANTLPRMYDCTADTDSTVTAAGAELENKPLVGQNGKAVLVGTGVELDDNGKITKGEIELQGTFSGTINKGDLIADGKDGDVTVKNGGFDDEGKLISYAVMVDDKGYESFESALSAIDGDGKTITLLKNVTLTGAADINNTVTIKAEPGVTVTRGKDYTGTFFTVADGKTLTLNGVTIDAGGKWSIDEEKWQQDVDLSLSDQPVTNRNTFLDNAADPIVPGSGNVTTTADLIVLKGSSDLTLTGGTVIQNIYATINSIDVIEASSGKHSITMEDATIKHFAGSGGSLIVSTTTGETTVALKSGALLTDNYNLDGNGGLFCLNTANSTLTMSAGAKVIDNRAVNCNGSVIMTENGATFIMEDGEISGNVGVQGSQNHYCQPVYPHVNGNFTMNGGSITGNTGSNVGAVYQRIITGGTSTGKVELNGGTIKDNRYIGSDEGKLDENSLGQVFLTDDSKIGSGMSITGDVSFYGQAKATVEGTITGNVHIFAEQYRADVTDNYVELKGTITGDVIVENGAKATNSGAIQGNVTVETRDETNPNNSNGTFTNTGTIDGVITLEKGCSMTDHGTEYTVGEGENDPSQLQFKLDKDGGRVPVLPEAGLYYTPVKDTGIVIDCADKTMWVQFAEPLPANTWLWFEITDEAGHTWGIAGQAEEGTTKMAWSFLNKEQFERWPENVEFGNGEYTVKCCVLGEAVEEGPVAGTPEDSYLAWTKTVTVQSELVPQITEPDVNIAPGIDADALEGAVENTGIDISDMAGLSQEAVQEVTSDEPTVVEDAEQALKDGGVQVSKPEDITVVVQTYVEIDVTAFTPGESLTYAITPMYRVVATTADDVNKIHVKGEDGSSDVNAVVIGQPQKLEVTDPVTLTLGLPSGFANDGDQIYIQHDNKYEYMGTAVSNTVTFENPHGFSTFAISLTRQAAAEIGGTSYMTLQDAVNAVKDGEEITVLASGHQTATAPAKNVTFTVTGNTDVEITDNGNYHVSKGAEGKYTVTYVAPPVPTTPTPSNPDTPDTDPVDAFVDVPAGVWYRDALNYVLENTTGVINGTDATHFSPNEKLTRAAFAKILWAIEGSKPTTAENPFTDVKSGDWFYDAVIWANAQGIMLGKGENLCAPNDNITREEMALMIQRWKAGKAAGGVAFPDAKDVHDWAADAVAWAAEQSYIKGKDDGRFAPLDSLTRAEMITVVARTLGFEG